MPNNIHKSALLACLLLIFCAAAPGEIYAQHNGHDHAQRDGIGRTDQDEIRILRQLTTHIVALNGRAQAGDPRAAAEMKTSAAARRELLSDLISHDPAEVLRVAIPDAFRRGLPADVRELVEEPIEADGTLEIMFEDRGDECVLLYSLVSGKNRYSLHFPGHLDGDLETGDRVRIHGVRIGEAVALEAKSVTLLPSERRMLTTVAPNTFGEQKVLVILVNFTDKVTEPYTLDHARSVVFGTTSNWNRENSFQQTWFAGDVVGWYTIPVVSTECNSSAIATYAKQAATAAGVNVSAYNRHVFAFPSNACSWWGLGSVGGKPSSAWVKGTFSLKVVGHELGHNLGLYHSKSLDCGASSIGDDCTVSEYGDTLDIMGNPSSYHFNAFQKERLGWLDHKTSPPITTVLQGGDYWLAPFQSHDTNPKALKILKSIDAATGKKTWYYVEYRKALGFDSGLSGNANVMNGVVVRTGSESSASSSYLLDMTPETSSWSDPALTLGRGFDDPATGLTVTPLSASSSGAMVNVSFGPQPCVKAKPVLTLSPAQTQWVPPGSTVTLTAVVNNRNSAGCGSATFSINPAVPGGWTASPTPSALTIAPGGSASATVRVTSPSSAGDAVYTVFVTSTDTADATQSATASATVALVASLDVTVSADQAVYSTNQWVRITADVKLPGATVTFTVIKPNNAKLTQTLTMGSDGTATYSFRTKKQDPAGEWTVTADASLNGVAGTASSTFMVK